MQIELKSKNAILLYLSMLISDANKFILAIDGRGGSGKSTIANFIVSEFQARIVNTDDYFDFDNGTAENYFWNKNEFVKDILKPLSQNNTASYKKNKWRDGKFTGEKEMINVFPSGLIIIEGLMSMQQSLLKYYSA